MDEILCPTCEQSRRPENFGFEQHNLLPEQCLACRIEKGKERLRRLNRTGVSTEDAMVGDFEFTQKSLWYSQCNECKEITLSLPDESSVCRRCNEDRSRKFYAENDLTPDVPPAFEYNFSFFEQQYIVDLATFLRFRYPPSSYATLFPSFLYVRTVDNRRCWDVMNRMNSDTASVRNRRNELVTVRLSLIKQWRQYLESDPTHGSLAYEQLFDQQVDESPLPANTVVPSPTSRRDGLFPKAFFEVAGMARKQFPHLFPTVRGDYANLTLRKTQPSKILYLRHLINLPRFGSDFIFVAWSWQRYVIRRILNDVSFYISNQNLKFVTLGAIRAQLDTEDAIKQHVRRLQYCISHVKGLAPFWNTKTQDVLAIFQERGNPHLFITVTAADFHWPELQELICQWEALESNQPFNPVREERDPRRYPHVVTSYCHQRIKDWIKLVLQRQNDSVHVADYWMRIEWQVRGAPHWHILAWLKDFPNVASYNLQDPHQAQDLAQRLHTVLGTPQRPIQHSLSVERLQNRQEDYENCIHHLQIHTCSPQTCLNENGRCNRGYPRPIQNVPTIAKNSKNHWMYCDPRVPGTEYVNHVPPRLLRSMRSTLDVAPVLSPDFIVWYLTKYVTKDDKLNFHPVDYFTNLLTTKPDDTSLQSLYSHLLCRYVLVKNRTAPELCHVLMGLPLTLSSFRLIHVRLPDSDTDIQTFDHDSESEDDVG